MVASKLFIQSALVYTFHLFNQSACFSHLFNPSVLQCLWYK